MVLNWKSASRHSAVRVAGRFTTKLTKRKFAFHHSGRRVVALIAAVSWHFGSTRASKSASRGPKHFAQEPARSTVFSANRRGAANPSISPKTWHGLRFPRQIRRGPVRT